MSETRASLAIRVLESVGTSLKALVVGASLFLPGLYWFVEELRSSQGCGTKLHIAHISFAVAMMVAGGIAIQPPFGKQLTSIVVTLFPNGIPLVGGRRASDPSSPPEEPKP
jgi:hypothetical protein